MTLVAGIDSSTQNCKVVIRDAHTGTLIRTGRAPHPPGTEIEPQHWWDALLTAVADAGELDDVSAIAIAGQQHGMVALDAEGDVIRPALLWNDTRSAGAATALISEFGAPQLAQRTGSVPVASFTATKLRWLRDAEPTNAARVAAVALPHDWLTWRLRGYGPASTSPLGPILEELVTDRSDASGTAYWNPTTGDYDRDILHAALGHDAILPRVLGPLDTAGVTAETAGIPAGIVIAPGAGDNAAAALGLGAQLGDAVISIGTSGTVFAVADRAVHDPDGTVAGFADAAGSFLPLIATLNAARVLDSIATLLDVDHDTFAALALQAAPASEGLVLQPYFEGERTPNLPDATATLFGMTIASTTRPQLARAAIEGMLCGLADGLDALRSMGIPVQRILLTGGAGANPAVQQVAAEIFDVPVDVPSPGEYVADGAARQATAVLHGQWPQWPVALDRHLPPQTVPAIRAQYAVRRTSTHDHPALKEVHPS